MRLHLARLLVCFGALVPSLFLPPSSAGAQSPAEESLSLEDALHRLADRVAAIPNHGPLRLQFFQDLAFAAETGRDWQDSFRQELESRRLSLTDDPAASVLRIGVAETPTQLVLSACLRTAEKDDVRLITFPRGNFGAARLPVASVRLEKQLLYETPERVLDASSLSKDGQSGMVLLAYRGAVLSVLRLDASGSVEQTIPLALAGASLSRDPRGELALHAGDAAVDLPGKSCQFAWATPADLTCRSRKTAWRSPTVLTASCDASSWKLFAEASDWTTPDLLQAVPDDSAQKGSATVGSDFPGPVLNINGEHNPSSALVVARNLRTGNYEVYRITLACGS